MRKQSNLLWFVVIAVFVITLAVAVTLIRWNNEGLERERSTAVLAQASAHLQLGMPRTVVEPYMDAAWRHYQCPGTGIDIYLFGSRNPNLAAILWLRFERRNGDQALAQVGTVESYMLDQYNSCTVYEKP